MPQLIKHIDKIAREKNRDVLFLFFDIVDGKKRKQILDWLDQEKIPYEPCGDYARHETIFSGGSHLYLDIPYDPEDATFLKLDNHFDKDGTPNILGVKFCYLPLDFAMKNQHHDEAGYWERIAENF